MAGLARDSHQNDPSMRIVALDVHRLSPAAPPLSHTLTNVEARRRDKMAEIGV
jgi:hypothetical protein